MYFVKSTILAQLRLNKLTITAPLLTLPLTKILDLFK